MSFFRLSIWNESYIQCHVQERKKIFEHENCSRNYQIYFNSNYLICRIFIFAIYFCDDLTSKNNKEKRVV